MKQFKTNVDKEMGKMKQQIDTYDDIDINIPLKKLFPLIALGLSILASPAMAVDINNEENNKIVAAMYGFINPKYIESISDKENDNGKVLVQSKTSKKQASTYSNDNAYVNLLIESVEVTSHAGAPDFSNK